MMHSDTVPGNKLRLAPDNRKGQLAVQHDNEGMVHVKWTDRSTGSVGLDRVVFPHDITFKRIRTGKDTDRVYELKYTANNNRFFFWMQVRTNNTNWRKEKNVYKLFFVRTERILFDPFSFIGTYSFSSFLFIFIILYIGCQN